MRTPKEYTDNLKKKIITEGMLEACLFSANKRAKNYRDHKREAKEYYGRYAKKYADVNYSAIELPSMKRALCAE